MLFWIFMVPMAQYQYPYLDLGENMNSPLNNAYRLWNFGLLNQKLKTQKWQYNQNRDPNPTCDEEVQRLSNGNKAQIDVNVR